jgi:Ca2+-binding RTX toxin-like protein
MPNRINGTPNDDILVGRDREDFIFIINDGIDIIRGFAGNDSLEGRGADDQLYGGEGDDRLDGGMGADRMEGGRGSDTYVVDNVSDVVIELLNEGLDAIESSISYTLVEHVENLTLTGSAHISGTGNDSFNTIRGNAGNNFLDGRGGFDRLHGGDGADTLLGGEGDDSLYGEAGNDRLEGGTGNDSLDGGIGADQMIGGAGSDRYYVDNIADVVIEGFAEGDFDSVESSIANYTLGNHVEHLRLAEAPRVLTGIGNDLSNNISGNSLANVLGGAGGNDNLWGGGGNDILTGGTGNDRLTGGAGDDLLTGDAGRDRFVFDSFRAFKRADMGVDTIGRFLSRAADFTPGQDKIELSKATFTTLSSRSSVSGVVGFSDVAEFAVVGTDAAAARSRADLVYNSTNGKLFYNPNGRAIGFDTTTVEGGHFVTLSGAPGLWANDFVLTEPALLI